MQQKLYDAKGEEVSTEQIADSKKQMDNGN